MEPEFINKVKYLFRVRKGFRGVSSSRPSLLIVDRSGVYSTVRRRYIRKTRYHRYRALAMDLGPVMKSYRLLQKLGLNSSWSEHDEITRWKHKVMDAYWHATPEKRKVIAMERYARHQRGMLYPAMALGVTIVVARWTQLMLVGRFEASFKLLLDFVATCLLGLYLVVRTEQSVTVHNVLEFELTK